MHAQTIAVVIMLVFATGCGKKATKSSTIIVNDAKFQSIAATMFAEPDFSPPDSSGSDMGRLAVHYDLSISPSDKNKEVQFDFSEFDSYLTSQAVFRTTNRGGDSGLYWYREWSNDERMIIVDVVLMKNGNLRLSYREVLR